MEPKSITKLLLFTDFKTIGRILSMDLTGTEITIISGLFIFESSDVSSINFNSRAF